MKTKLLAVMATGLAVLFLGAAPNMTGKSRKMADSSANTYGMYGNSRTMNGSYIGNMMDGAARDSTYRGMADSSYCPGYAMMYGGRYGMMSGRGYGMMPMMMSMMGMRSRMMYGAGDSSFVCPYYNNAGPKTQKEGK